MTTTNTSHNGTLTVIRHTESEWNLLGVWTGITDISLTPKGKADAEIIGTLLKGRHYDIAYTSNLVRTQQTLEGVLKGKGDQQDIERIAVPEFTERDYGDLTGKNKWEVQSEIGEEAFNGIRRGWDYPVPGGETLKDVYNRAQPYFIKELLPRLQTGEDILLVAHGNSIRALMKFLDNIPEEKMAEVEMLFGSVLIYTFDSKHDLPISKEVLQATISKTHA